MINKYHNLPSVYWSVLENVLNNRWHGCSNNLTMNIHDFFITLSGPSCSFQDHIYVSVELHHHKIKKCITSKVYHDTYKLHQNFLAFLKKWQFSQKFWKIPDFLGNFLKISIYLYIVNFGHNYQTILIFMEIFSKISISYEFWKIIMEFSMD